MKEEVVVIGAKVPKSILTAMTDYGRISNSDAVKSAVEFHLLYRDFDIFGGNEPFMGSSKVEKLAHFTAKISAENSQLRRQYANDIARLESKLADTETKAVKNLRLEIEELKETINRGCFMEIIDQLHKKQA